MQPKPAHILILGAADTGRAPMSAALLRRLLEQRKQECAISSAGILGHDGDAATPEAIQTMEQMNLDIGEHVARSLDDDLAEQATLLIAVDSGTARVARARFPQVATQIVILGELAGRSRDIPDPFKMQLGAWLTYAREIESLLRLAMPRILVLAGITTEDSIAPSSTEAQQVAPIPVQPTVPPVTSPSAPSTATDPNRTAALDRMQRLLAMIEQMPDVIDWNAAKAQIDSQLSFCETAIATGDLASALVGLVRAALSLTPNVPNLTQCHALQDAINLLKQPVSAVGLAAFSARLGVWAEL